MLTMIKALLGLSANSTSVRDAAELVSKGVPLVDVRELGEWQSGHVPKAIHIPLGDLRRIGVEGLLKRVGKLGPDRPCLFICQSGMRSAMACQNVSAGLGKLAINVTGGMIAWRRAGLDLKP